MRRRTWAVVAALAAVAGLTLALVDSGSTSHPASRPTKATSSKVTSFADLPSAEIARQAVADTKKLQTVHVRIALQERHAVLVIDVRRTRTGVCFGHFTDHGRSASVIATDDYSYLRGSARFWRTLDSRNVGDVMATQPARWARFPANPELQDFCDVPALLTRIDLDQKALSHLVANSPYPLDEATVLDLTNSDSEIRVTVDVDAPHYLREVHDYEGDVRLSEYDVPVSVRIPGAGEFVPFHDSTAEV